MTDNTLEGAILAELSKDVKLKNGSILTDEQGTPIKVQDAIAKSIVNNAMKGDLAAASFIRNLTQRTDPATSEQRRQAAEARRTDIYNSLRSELEADGLWCDQTTELEQLAQNAYVIEQLNQQMLADDYTDTIQEFKKDGTVVIRINPLHEWRDRYQTKFLQDWKDLRIDSQRRIIARQQMQRRK